MGHHHRGTHDLVLVYDFLRQSANDDQWPVTFHWFSPNRACAISANPGGRHEGLWLDVDCGSIISWDGVVGASVFMVALGHLPLWAANKDPLGQAWQLLLWLQWVSCGTGSISLGELTSTQLEGAMATKTSTSVKETRGSITHQSSTTLSARR